MYLQICVLALIPAFIFTLERGAPCTTPNGERVTCVSILSCPGILNAVLMKNASGWEFVRRSQCGYDTEPLVCCRFEDYSPTTFEIFTRPPHTSTSDSNTDLNEDINFNTNVLPSITECGLDRSTNVISDGEIANFYEFPWLAALEYKSKITGKDAGIRCGGSIINSRYILTAAQCIIDIEFEVTDVILGEWKLSTDPDCEKLVANTECAEKVQKLKVVDKIPHPYYSKRFENNDIGLVKLETDITYTAYIYPICLPPIQLPAPSFGTPLIASGWGATRSGTVSDIKLNGVLQVIPNNICKKGFQNRLVTANQICVRSKQEKVSYRGDSGGPLMRVYKDKVHQQNRWFQEGVGSWGVGYDLAGEPAVYTRTSRYIRWIINSISSC